MFTIVKARVLFIFIFIAIVLSLSSVNKTVSASRQPLLMAAVPFYNSKPLLEVETKKAEIKENLVKKLDAHSDYIRKRLVSPKFFYYEELRLSDGKTKKIQKNLNYVNKNKPTGVLDVTVSRIENRANLYTVSLENNVSYYVDIKEDRKVFRKRVKQLEKEMSYIGLEINVKNTEADHMGSRVYNKMLSEDEEDLKDPFPTVSKPTQIHLQQGKLRPLLEKKAIAKEVLDPLTKKIQIIRENKTNYGNNDNILTHFEKRQKEAALVRDNIDPSLFSKSFTKKTLSNSERLAIELEKDETLDAGKEKNLDFVGMLVNLKGRSAIQGYLSDVTRLKKDVTLSVKAAKMYENVFLVPQEITTQVFTVFEHGKQVKIYLEGCLKVFAQQENRPALEKILKKMLVEHSEKTEYLINRLTLYKIPVNPEATRALTLDYAEARQNKELLPPSCVEMSRAIDNSTKTSLDQSGANLELDNYQRPRTSYRLSRNYVSRFTDFIEPPDNSEFASQPIEQPGFIPEEFVPEDYYL